MPSKAPKPKSSRTAAVRDDTRQAIIDAAIDLFAEKGYDATTTRDIAGAAALNISLISYYFGGKEGLLDATLDCIQSQIMHLAAPALKPAANIREFAASLREFIDRFVTSHANNPNMHRVVQREQERNSPAFQRMVHSAYLQGFAKIVEFFADGQRRGWVSASADPATVAIALHGAMVQQLRFDRFRREIQGKTLAEAAHRAKVIDDLAMLFGRGILASTT